MWNLVYRHNWTLQWSWHFNLWHFIHYFSSCCCVWNFGMFLWHYIAYCIGIAFRSQKLFVNIWTIELISQFLFTLAHFTTNFFWFPFQFWDPILEWNCRSRHFILHLEVECTVWRGYDKVRRELLFEGVVIRDIESRKSSI